MRQCIDLTGTRVCAPKPSITTGLSSTSKARFGRRLIGLLATLMVAGAVQAQTTYYSKAAATNFSDPASWGANTDGSGAAPGSVSNADNFIVANSAALVLDASASVRALTVTSGSLTVSGNTLTVSRSSGNNSTLLINGGTLNLSTGTITVNGNFSMTSGALNQSGGAISVDGNDNNTAATSIGTATHMFAITGGTPNCTAGSITIVDPPINTNTTGVARAISISLAAGNNYFSGTHTFILGDGVSTTPGNTDGFVVETYASSRAPIQNLTVNGGATTGRWGSGSYGTSTAWGTHIKGTLTINSGSEFRINQLASPSSASEILVGSIVNNGIFTTGRATQVPTIYIGGHPNVSGYTPSTASSITGSGTYRNLTASATGAFTNLAFNNTNGISFGAGTLSLGALGGHVSGTLTFTAGTVNLNGQTFVLGISGTSVGTLAYTAGGFNNGTFKRYVTTSTLGTTYTTTTPTFPFINSSNQARHVYLFRSATLGSAGSMSATFTEASGLTPVTINDGLYTIDQRSNTSWGFAIGDGLTAGSATFMLGLAGEGLMPLGFTPGTAPRIVQATTALGTHQAATGTTAAPIAARTSLALASLTGNLHYHGVNTADLAVYTVQSGNWENGSTWNTGSAPTSSSSVQIMSGHTVTINGTPAAAAALQINNGGIVNVTGSTLTLTAPAASGAVGTISSGAQLNITGGTVNVGTSGASTRFAGLQNNGTLTISSGNLNVYGYLINAAGSFFTQSGGAISIDQNAAGSAANSYTAGAGLQFLNAAANISITGGSITLVDPNANTTLTASFLYSGTGQVYVDPSHTFNFGDGVSTDAGGNAAGFRFTPGTNFVFGNVVVNALAGTNRIVSHSTTTYVRGNLTINSGSEWSATSILGLAGNLVNNGTFTSTSTLSLLTHTGGATAVNPNAQSIGGTGVFRNNATTPTANLSSFLINNSNATGVTLNVPLQVSGTLTMTSGIINTTSTNLLTLGTSTGAGTLSGTPSATNMVKGPFARMIPASQTGTTTYVFPVGKSGYNNFDLVNPVTTSGGAVTIQAEVFDGNAGGTPSAAFSAISTSRYWQVQVLNGAANLTSSLVRLNDTRGSFDGIGSSTTQTGTYNLAGGGATTLTATSITTGAAITGSSLPAFYLMGTLAPPTMSAPGISLGAGDRCTGSVPRDITVTVTPAAAAISTVVINYTVNGGAVQTVSMTNTGGNNWAGTIPAVTPSNGTVAWSVKATDANGLIAVQTGTSYFDNPMSGVTVSVASSASAVCDGTSITLTATPSTVTAALGAGGTNSSSAATSPFYHAWGGVKTQYIIRASELSAMGLTAGKLKSIGFEITTLGTTPMKDFSIRIGHTTATAGTPNSAITSGLTLVYSNASQTMTTGLNTYNFTTPFTWDGSSNVVVSIVYNNNNGGGTSHTVKSDAVGFVSSVAIYGDNITNTNDLVNASSTTGITSASGTSNASTSNRPRMTFTAESTIGSYAFAGTGYFDYSNTNSITFVPASTNTYQVIGYELADMGGCATPISTTGVTVTVNPVPSAPSATNSTQCGTHMPTASVASTSGMPTPTFKWYSAATGGTLLQSSTSTTYTTAISSTTTFYVSEINTTTGCEGARTAVTVTVNTPDAVAASSNVNNVCPGTTVTLSAQQTGSTQNYTYTWTASPVSGSGIATSVTGASVQVVPTAGGTYTYTLTAVDGTCQANATVNVTITTPPAITTATGPTVVCPGASVALSASSINVQSGTATLGTATTSNSTTSNAGAAYPTYYGNGRQQYLVLASELQALGLNAGPLTSLAFNVETPGTANTLNGYTIKIGTTSATAITTFQTLGSAVTVWGPTNYTPVAGLNTHTFTTPFTWDGTSNILVEICFNNLQSQGSTNQNVTKYTATAFSSSVYYQTDATTGDACTVTTVSGSTSNRPNMRFGGQVATDITSGYTWTWNPGGLSGASVTATAPANNTGAPVNQVYTVTATDAGTGCSSTAQVSVSVNPSPSAPAATNSTQCGNAIPTASVTSTSGLATPSFKWFDASSGGNLLQSGSATTYGNEISSTTTFYVSELNTTTGCESARTPVTVTVTAADAITAVANGPICLGSSINLSVNQTGSTQNYTYTWSATPAAGSGIATTLTGGTQTITPTAAGTYVYNVDGVDGSCANTSSISVTVNPNPPITSQSATPGTVCPGAAISLTAASISAAQSVGTVGTDNATTKINTTGNPYRSGTTSGFQIRNQYLVTAAELAAAGYIAGDMNSIGFIVNTNGNGSFTNLTFKFAHTALTALTSTFATPTSWTTVLTQASYTPAVGTNTHTFTTPFAWDGTSNILIEVCTTLPTSASTTTLATTTTAFVATVGQAASGGCTAATGTTLSTRPVLVLGGLRGVNNTGNFTWTWNPGGLTGASATATAPANNSGAPVTQVYTVTATNAATGCFSTATASVTVNPSPGAPTASNSTQCGTAIPTASVASTSGLATPTFKWYDAASAGNMLQNSTSTTYTASVNTTTTFYVSEVNTATGCESARTPVTVTVNQPDAVTASANGPVCLGAAVNLLATQTGATNNYTFVWTATPASGSGIATSINGASNTVTPTTAGSYAYMVTATDAAAGCITTSTVNVTVNANPVVSTVTSSVSSVCPGGALTLTATSSTTAAGSVTVGDGATTSSSYPAPFYSLWSNKHMQLLFKASELTAANLRGGNITALSFPTTSGTVAIQNVTIKMANTAQSDMSTFVGSGFTTVFTAASLAQTANTDNRVVLQTPFVWDGTSNVVVEICFGVSSSGATLSSTSPVDETGFTSVIKTHVSAGTDGAVVCGNTATNLLTYTTRPKVIFEGQKLTDLTGNYTWNWMPGNLSGAVVNTTAPVTPGVVTYTAKATNAATGCFASGAVNVTVGAAIVINTSSTPATICAGASATISADVTGGGAPYTYSWKDANNNVVGTTASVSVSPASTMVYTLTVTDFCGTNATQNVTVTVNALPTVSITPNTTTNVCATTQSLTSTTNAATPAYQWLLNGNNINLATASSYNATASGNYSLRVTDGATGCIGTSTATTLSFKPLPSTVAITPSSTTVCFGTPQLLTAASSYTANASGTIGTGTATSTTATPYKGFFGGVKIQYLYKASELTALGAVANTQINSLALNISAYTSPYTFNGFTIAMKNTTSTALTATAITGLTTVLAPTSFTLTGTAPFTVSHTLTTPFVWDGTSNIVVEFCFNNNDAGGASGNSASVLNTTTTGGAAYFSADNNASVCGTTTGWTTSTARANMTFGLSTTRNSAITWSTGGSSYTGLYTDAAGNNPYTGAASATVYANPAANTTYTALATTIDGCTTSSNVTVNSVMPSTAPSMLNSSATGATCPGANVILTQTGGSLGTGAHWQWYRDAAYTLAVGGPLTSSNAQITVAPAATTTYYLRAEGGTAPCAANISGSASVVVTVRTPLSASIAAAQPVQCETGLTATLNITGGPANGTVTVTTNGANPQTITLDGSGAATFTSDPLMANATFTITSVSDGTCTTTTNTSATVYVGVLIADPISNQSVCAGSTVGPIAFSGNFPAGTQYSWTSSNPAVGLAQSSGTGTQLPAFTATNSGTTDIYTDIAVTPIVTSAAECKVRQMVFRITVRPVPTMNAVGSQTVCAGTMTTPVTFSSSVAGASYIWSNSNPAIGIAASGGGNLPAFVAQNNTGAATISGTITVTPVAIGCSGVPTTFTITVNRSAAAIAYTGSPYCQVGTVNPVLTGTRGGTFSSTAGLVISATTGQINLGQSLPGTYTITYTAPATAGGCGGAVTTQISIKPQAVVNTIGNQEYCQGLLTAPVPFSGTATNYAWSNSNPSIGLAASGTGTQLPSFTTVNGGPLANDAYIAVTPLGNGTSTCDGRAIKFRFRVKFCPPVTQAGGTGGGSATARMASQVVVGPNPSTGRVTLNYTGTEAGPFTVQLLTQYGQAMNRPVTFTGTTYTLDLTGMTPGVYVIQLVNTRTNTTIQKQIVKL